MWDLDDMKTNPLNYDNNDRKGFDDVQTYPFNYNDLVKMCENLFDLFSNLKSKHSNLKKYFSSLEISTKTKVNELDKVKRSYKNLQDKKIKIENYFFKELA